MSLLLYFSAKPRELSDPTSLLMSELLSLLIEGADAAVTAVKECKLAPTNRKQGPCDSHLQYS